MRKLGLLAASLLAGCAPQSLYVTSSKRLPEGGQYQFIAPYFAEVTNRLAISITPGTPGKEGPPAVLPGPPSMTLSVIPVPTARAYLYMTKDALFSNTVNIAVANDGLLSSSDSASTQQVTAILGELAQTAGAFIGPQLVPRARVAAPVPSGSNDRDQCLSALKTLVKTDPYYVTANNISSASRPYPLYSTKSSSDEPLALSLVLNVPAGLVQEQAKVNEQHDGLVAFFPVPSVATLECQVNDRSPIQLSAPITLNLYLDSSFVTPKRDFLTNPQDTITFNEGFITGHKFINQSPAKTVVDTVTAPIRAIMPSVTVTNQTQIQTGGGKPDQTTSSAQTQIAPPKGP
jgi:hypothetical protein